MRVTHVLATSAVVIAIGGCAAAVVAIAAGQPRSHGDRPLQALPTLTTPHASIPAPSTAASTLSTQPPASSPRPRPSTSSRRTPKPAARPAPRTTSVSPRPAPKPSPKPAPQRGQALPLGYGTGTATRVITVVAASTGSTTAVLQAWNKAPGGGWMRYGSAVTAHVGSQGLTTQPSESKSATPIGSFTLNLAFGALSNPGTGLPYIKTSTADWWISQSGPLYNTHQHCSGGCSFTQGDPNEHLRNITPFYYYAVVIDYNRFPVRQGAGSAFFLHVTDGAPTAGCVAISQSKLVSLMQWLRPSTHPRMLIGLS